MALVSVLTVTACSQESKKETKKEGDMTMQPKKKVTKEVAVIETDMGQIVVKFYDEDAPAHVANFKKLAREGFYNGTTFHRVIKNFMIQGGDPNSKDNDPANDGIGGPGYTVPQEIKRLHKWGALAAARQGDHVNPKRASSGSQFYIVQNHSGTPHLDGAYTVYGEVLTGLDVVDQIADVQVGPNSRPLENVVMKVSIQTMEFEE